MSEKIKETALHFKQAIGTREGIIPRDVHQKRNFKGPQQIQFSYSNKTENQEKAENETKVRCVQDCWNCRYETGNVPLQREIKSP